MHSDRALLLTALFTVVPACVTSAPPARTSATPTFVADGPSPGSVVDSVAVEPSWWDATTGRVMRLDGSEVVVVRDEALAHPDVIRVLDDDTIVTFRFDVGLTVWPSSSAAFVVPEASARFDGVDVESLWYLSSGSGSDDVELCRVVRTGGRECVASRTFPYGPGPLGVDADGAVYVTGGEHIERWNGRTLVPLSGGETDLPVSFRHGIGPGLLLVGSTAVHRVSSEGVEPLFSWSLVGPVVVAGSPDHFVVGELERDSTRACGGNWFGNACGSRENWSQWVFTEVTRGITREIGHQDCVRAEAVPSCGWTTDALSFGSGEVTIVGAPIRQLAL